VKGEEGAEQRVHKKAIFVYLSASLAPTSASDVARGGLKEAKKGFNCWYLLECFYKMFLSESFSHDS
jgi:hypothetical protein